MPRKIVKPATFALKKKNGISAGLKVVSKIPHTLQFCLICRFLRQHTFVFILKDLFAGSIIKAANGGKFIVTQ